MITSKEFQGKTIYFVTEEAEWKDLSSKGQIVYRADESQALQQLNDAEINALVFRLKCLIPSTFVYQVR